MLRILWLELFDRAATFQERLDRFSMGGFQWHQLAVHDPPFHRLTQSLTLEIRFVPQTGFVLLLALRRLVATAFTAVQSDFVLCLELRATDRAIILVDLAFEVLMLVTTGLAAKDAAQHSQRRATVLTLGATGGL